MSCVIFAVAVLQIGVFALDERILQHGSNGTAAVLLTVAYIEKSSVFADDNGMLRRIAYVETRDGTRGHQNIWAVSRQALQQTQLSDHPTLNVKHNLIALEFAIGWNTVELEDLERPFYSAIAARLLLFLAPERLPDSNDIEDQARFWKQYYNINGSLSDFTGAAYELEGNVLESSSSQFFVAFGRNDADDTSSATLRLFISSTEPDPVPVTVESLRGFTFTGIAINNETLVVDIPNTFQVFSSLERDKGLRVTAEDSNIVVYGLNYDTFTSDAFLALPCDRLPVETYEYYGLTYLGSGLSQILIVGCEDGSTVQIGSETIELNRMETHLLESYTELTGTKIVSNRPLVVYPGNRCTDIPLSSSACDHITEQVPPTAIWGKNFMSASYAGRRSGDIYRILASQNSTTVTVNCNTFTQVLIYELESPGSWQEISTPANSFCSISSNKPLLVMQFGLGNSHDRVGDPFMMMITPVEQYSNNYVFDVLPEFISNYITIYVTPDHFSPQDIIVDDDSLENAAWTTVYCTDTMICGYITYVTLTAGEHQLYHRDVTAHIGVSAYGFNSYNSYGYPGGLQLEPVQLATISFSQSEFMVRENEGVVKVELVRSGDTSSEVVVLIGNHPYYGSAAVERDYIPIIEIVTFLSEEVTKTVDIHIIDDINVEYDETFILYLTSGEGVHLSPFSRAKIVIKNDDGRLTLNPRYGTELGGTPIIVSGTKLTAADDDNVTCIFDRIETVGSVINEDEVLCVSPELTRTGRVPFDLHISGQNSSFTGIAIYISVAHDKASTVIFENQDPFISSLTVLKLRWSPQSILPIQPANSYTVDIILREYNITSQEWKFTSLAKNVPNTGYIEVTVPEMAPAENYNDSVVPAVVQISVSKSSSDQLLQSRKRGLLRRIAVETIAILTKVLISIALPNDLETRLFCEVWGLTQSRKLAQQIAAELPPCPCTENDIESPGSRDTFTKEERVFAEGLQRVFHPDAKSCFRERNPRSISGQQCCYNGRGDIIVGPQSGGNIDFIAPTNIGTTFLHFLVDVVPHILCCMPHSFFKILSNCAKYYRFRPSDDCSRTRPRRPGTARGDPHLVTLDGLEYTFNGRGEYTLIETTDNVFTLQGRMILASGSNETEVAATVFSAIVGKDNNSDTVQFEVDGNGTLTAIVAGELVVFDITEQEFEQVTVTHLGNNSIEVLFDSGVYVLARGENGFISSLLVVFPDSFTDKVQGLLGTYNGDTTDDLLPKFGHSSLSPDANEEDIHNKFGVTWIVDSARKSLFFYQPEESWDTFYDPYFTPLYLPTFSDPELESQARDICGDNKFCLFDIAATGLVDVGVATLESSNVIDEIYSFLIPVVCDPPCEFGACVTNDTCKCSEGYTGTSCSEIVILECEENICKNGGSCSVHVGDYRCDCPAGFSGFLCEDETHTSLTNDKRISTTPVTIGVTLAAAGILSLSCVLVVLGMVLRSVWRKKYEVGEFEVLKQGKCLN